MTDMPSIAQTVYYRHPCDCPTASRPLAPGQQPEHRFDIDGQPFPWYITTNGATFTHTLAGLYIVRCTIIPLASVKVDIESGADFVIDGRPFPWLVTTADFGILNPRLGTLLLTIGILAEHVDTDTDIQQET